MTTDVANDLSTGDGIELEVTGQVRRVEKTEWMKLGHLRFVLAAHGLALCPLPGAKVVLPEAPARTKEEKQTEDGPETMAQTWQRLAPVLSRLKADGRSTFLDLCELVLMAAEDIQGSIKWDHPRVLVHVKQLPRPKKPKAVPAKRAARV